jgi:ribosome biogenesis protein Nip4
MGWNLFLMMRLKRWTMTTQMIDSFISQFTEQKLLHVERIGRCYYQILPALRKQMEKADKALEKKAFSAGIFLGEEKGKKFLPSVALVEMIGRASHRWVKIDDKTEWLFLCGRDVFAKGVVKANVRSGMVIVVSKGEEVLGYGKIVGDLDRKEKVYVKNFLDKGDYLRREMGKKKAS